MIADSMQKLRVVHLNNDEFQQLTHEVKETIAHVQPVKKGHKRFTAAQLWNHRRNARTASLWTRNSNSPIHLY
jgi:hypothetical protein